MLLFCKRPSYKDRESPQLAQSAKREATISQATFLLCMLLSCFASELQRSAIPASVSFVPALLEDLAIIFRHRRCTSSTPRILATCGTDPLTTSAFPESVAAARPRACNEAVQVIHRVINLAILLFLRTHIPCSWHNLA